MLNVIQKGEILQLEAPEALDSGDPIMVGDLFCVAVKDLENGERGSFIVQGVVELPQAGDTIGEGDTLYFDESEGELTTDDDTGANPRVGHAVEASGSSDPTVKIRIQN